MRWRSGVVLLLLLGQGSSANATGRHPETVLALRSAPVIALTHVRIIDGTGGPSLENQVIVIEGATIRAVGKIGAVDVPKNAHVVDLAGHTVLPGLVMLHEHLAYNANPQATMPEEQGIPGLSHPQHFSFPRLYLAFGVTTIRTAGTDHPYADLNLKRQIDAGTTPGPEIHLSSPFLSGESDPFLGSVVVRNGEEARRIVRYWAAEGFTSFKAYKWIPRESLAAVIREAHQLGLRVTAHLGGGGTVSCGEAAEMGIDNLEHGLAPCIKADGLEPKLEGPKTEALLKTLLNRRVVLTQTFDRRGEPLSEQARELLDASARERYEKTLAARGPSRAMTGNAEPHTTPYANWLRRFVRNGGELVLGSDAGCCGGGNQIAGLASHHPLKTLVRLGFSPLEAIRIATLNGATFLGIAKRTGSIDRDKEADLLIIRGNPEERLEDLNNVEIVFANGIPYDPRALLKRVAGQVGWR